MGVFHSKKQCPICGRENKIRIGAFSGGGKGTLVFKSNCDYCRYEHMLFPESLLIFLGFAFIVGFLILFFLDPFFLPDYSGLFLIVLLISVFMIPLCIGIWFIHAKIFENYINKRIIKLHNRDHMI
jgi:hypothetical protein